MRLAALPALILALPAAAEPVAQGPKNVPGFEPAFAGQTRAAAVESGVALTVTPLAGGLSHPWGLAALPEGGWLVTERAGRLRHVAADGTLSDPVAGVPEVVAQGQGGLLDVALAEDFPESRPIYLSYSRPVEGGSVTAVARGRLAEDHAALEEVADIFLQRPAAGTPAHFGSRVTPQGGYLWITTGERQSARTRELAQDLGATYGKVVRLFPDGSVPPDNPFVETEGALPEIWSFGHRNIQGDAVDAQGRYWTVEHGPQGGDELNLPQAGRNYGWPVISYGQDYDGSPIGGGLTAAEGMEQPVYYWDPVIAPGDMVFYSGAMFPEWEGSLLVASLTPGGLNRLVIEGERVTGEERLLPDLGRVRDVEVDRDGALLLLTDAEDGTLLRVERAE